MKSVNIITVVFLCVIYVPCFVEGSASSPEVAIQELSHFQQEDAENMHAVSVNDPRFFDISGHPALIEVTVVGQHIDEKFLEISNTSKLEQIILNIQLQQDYTGSFEDVGEPMLVHLSTKKIVDAIHFVDIEENKDILPNATLRFKVTTKSVHAVSFTFSKLSVPLAAKYQVVFAFILLVAMYAVILWDIVPRPIVAMAGCVVSLSMVWILKARPPLTVVVAWVDNGAIWLLLGMMIIVGMMSSTGVFEFLAVKAFRFSKGSLWRLVVFLCTTCAILSAFLDNVTTILLLSPVTLRLAQVVKVDPIPILLSEVMFSNIGGTATMVGDPPNIIIGNYFSKEITFIDFIVNLTPSLIIGAIVVFAMIRYMIRHQLDQSVPPEKRKHWSDRPKGSAFSQKWHPRWLGVGIRQTPSMAKMSGITWSTRTLSELSLASMAEDAEKEKAAEAKGRASAIANQGAAVGGDYSNPNVLMRNIAHWTSDYTHAKKRAMSHMNLSSLSKRGNHTSPVISPRRDGYISSIHEHEPARSSPLAGHHVGGGSGIEMAVLDHKGAETELKIQPVKPTTDHPPQPDVLPPIAEECCSEEIKPSANKPPLPSRAVLPAPEVESVDTSAPEVAASSKEEEKSSEEVVPPKRIPSILVTHPHTSMLDRPQKRVTMTTRPSVVWEVSDNEEYSSHQEETGPTWKKKVMNWFQDLPKTLSSMNLMSKRHSFTEHAVDEGVTKPDEEMPANSANTSPATAAHLLPPQPSNLPPIEESDPQDIDIRITAPAEGKVRKRASYAKPMGCKCHKMLRCPDEGHRRDNENIMTKEHKRMLRLEKEFVIHDRPMAMKSVAVLGCVVIMFCLQQVHGIEPAWLAMAGATILMLISKTHELEPLLAKVEWGTLLFFSALFIFVESLVHLGLIRTITSAVASVITTVPPESRLIVAIVVLMWVSAIASAFIDNVPWTATMVPLVAELAEDASLNLPLRPLIWALSLGACLGGNGSLIGASANIVAVGCAAQRGYTVTFKRFLAFGMPIMIVTVTISMVYSILVYGVIGAVNL